MYQDKILANSFILKPRGIQVFRLQREGIATVLWTSRLALLKYLQDLQGENVWFNNQSH